MKTVTRTPSKLIPHRPPGNRSLARIHTSVTTDERQRVLEVAQHWFGVDVSVLLYFKSIREILRLHAVVFPKGKAPALTD